MDVGVGPESELSLSLVQELQETISNNQSEGELLNEGKKSPEQSEVSC